MDLSVIVPVYNGEKTIENCLRSILSQTLENIEIIVINDGSTDNTPEKVKSIKDARIRLISVKNGGQGMARNIGIEEATGEYIGFVDADDTICPGMYEKMVRFAKENHADVIQCAINDIFGEKSKTRPELKDEFIKITSKAEYAKKYFYTMKHTNEVCNKIFSSEFIKKTGLRFSDTKEIFSEDLKFNLDMLEKIKSIGFVENAFYNYFISDEGHCRNETPERVRKIFNLYIEALKNMKDKKIRRLVKSMAVVTVLSYSTKVTDEVRDVICSKKLMGFMIESCLFKKTVKHTLLMAALIIMPYRFKKKIIISRYTF